MKRSYRPELEASFIPNTLVNLLRWRADQDRDKLVYRFLEDKESDILTITYAELDRRARAIGAWLESFGA
ncbi:MAG TPA: hypothetical protein VJL10_06570, partial [Anaerolineales bacterium]|nr:hypothetical protein [Anaerolineales bacterium]